ncbi:MAG: hypothetical protein FWD47_03250 [Treponema sp.]|nr:hypothetical protein [Treponema sp.]
MANFRWGVIAAVIALFVSVTLGFFFGVAFLHIFLRALIFGVVFFGLGFGLRFVINSFFPELMVSSEEHSVLEEQSGARINITIDGSGEYAVPELFKSVGDSDELGNIEDLISGSFRAYRNEEREEDNEESEKVSPNQWFDSSLNEEGIDRKKEEGYNDLGFGEDISFDDLPGIEGTAAEKPAVSKPEVFQPQFTPSFGDDSGLGGLPDLDMMARAFSTAYSSTSASSAGPAPAAVPLPSMPAVSEDFSAPSSSSSFFLTEEPDRSHYKGNKAQQLEGDFNPKDIAKGISTILSKD